MTDAPALEIGRVRDPLQWAQWPAARAMLDPALAQSDEAWPEVEAELAAGTMELVAVMDGCDLLAAAVIRTALTSNGDVLEVYICGGHDFGRWAEPLAVALRDSARAAGMICTRIIGRLGWQRVLAGSGFVPKLIVLEAA